MSKWLETRQCLWGLPRVGVSGDGYRLNLGISDLSLDQGQALLCSRDSYCTAHTFTSSILASSELFLLYDAFQGASKLYHYLGLKYSVQSLWNSNEWWAKIKFTFLFMHDYNCHSQKTFKTLIPHSDLRMNIAFFLKKKYEK